MQLSKLTLRGLELFQLAAQSGSVQSVADATGLSISTVSHHLRSLEETVGTPLLDHRRRPMVLTPAGTAFLARVDQALALLRRGETELMSTGLMKLRELRLGIVDDFDSEVAPELTLLLAQGMPDCAFRHQTRASHETLQQLRRREIDVSVATRPMDDLGEGREFPVLRDPFVIALPRDTKYTPEDCMAGRSSLPLIRYSRDQIVGRMIEAHLRRSRVTLHNRFELESNPALMSLVADGAGWAITTPASYMRVARFHSQITLWPLPGNGFSRVLSVFCAEEGLVPIAEMVAAQLRPLVQRRVVEPGIQQMKWLEDQFRVLDGSPE